MGFGEQLPVGGSDETLDAGTVPRDRGSADLRRRVQEGRTPADRTGGGAARGHDDRRAGPRTDQARSAERADRGQLHGAGSRDRGHDPADPRGAEDLERAVQGRAGGARYEQLLRAGRQPAAPLRGCGREPRRDLLDAELRRRAQVPRHVPQRDTRADLRVRRESLQVHRAQLRALQPEAGQQGLHHRQGRRNQAARRDVLRSEHHQGRSRTRSRSDVSATQGAVRKRLHGRLDRRGQLDHHAEAEDDTVQRGVCFAVEECRRRAARGVELRGFQEPEEVPRRASRSLPQQRLRQVRHGVGPGRRQQVPAARQLLRGL